VDKEYQVEVSVAEYEDISYISTGIEDDLWKFDSD